MVEGTQRKLAERIEDTNRRNEELANLLDLQRQTLHQLSGLSREDATRRLLDMLEAELQARGRRRSSCGTKKSWPKPAKPRPARSCSPPFSATPRPTPPKPPPAPSTSPTTK